MTEDLELHGGFEIETPEQVAFRMERAGLGSRAFAAMLDTVILFVLYLGLFFGFFGLVSAIWSVNLAEDWDSSLVQVLWAVFILVSSFLFSGYYILFEWFWNGQTPGKRALSIRVVADGGIPATFGRIVIRNLVRLVDFLGGYAVGVIVIFASRQEKRLGDLVAGTVVIREARRSRGEILRLGAPTPAARRLDPELLDLVRRYWERANDLDADTRRRLARDLLARVAPAMNRAPTPGLAERDLLEITRDLFETDGPPHPSAER
ncbi:MAG: RDD family protein [Gemmatimonadetes bacterium]|nr:RDD family protein [Gemmatimonadota bacterium]